MAIQREYYIEDFDEYADERFPEEYTALRTCHTWVMEYKTIRDGANKLRRVPMLLVGRPFFHHGIQNAWAWATGTTIEYYHAHRHEEIVSTLAGLFMNKVYYGVPLIYAAGHQDTSHGMTKSRRTVKALAELVINFMFLLEGQIEFVPNPGNADLLSDFEYACRMFVMRRDEDINNMNNVYMPYYATSDDQAGARSFGSPISGGSSTTHTFSRIKKEPRDDGATPTLVSGSPYRATNSSSSGRAASTKSYGTSASYEPFVPVKKEHDEGNAPSIHWSGSSHTSTSSRTPSTSYHGMFAPHASTIRSSGATPSNPFRLSMSSGPGTTSSSVSNKSSSSPRYRHGRDSII